MSSRNYLHAGGESNYVLVFGLESLMWRIGVVAFGRV